MQNQRLVRTKMALGGANKPPKLRRVTHKNSQLNFDATRATKLANIQKAIEKKVKL